MTRLLLLTAVAVAASAQPAHDLARAARSAALERSDPKEAQSLIDSALKRWERDQEPHDADYARALDLAGMLAQHRKADLATVVEPLYREALEVFDHEGFAVPQNDTAVALELEARALGDLGRLLDAAALKDRAFRIRAAIVHDMKSPPPAPTVAGRVARIGGGVKPPQVISKREPAYNNLARLMKVQGMVLVEVVIAADGTPQAFRLLRSLGFGLDEQAVRTVQEWRFQPATKDGDAVAVFASIEVNFGLL